MTIEHQPITGTEVITDPASPTSALVQFYRGFNARDIEQVVQNWEQSDVIVMDNPLGGIKRGWREIGAVYRKLFNGPVQVTVEFYDYSIVQDGPMFFAAGRERGELRCGDRQLSLAIRTSRIYRRLDGSWRQVHHHGSIDDPELLAAYQNAVLG
jgi:ketosteroid isomerase-like protein